MLRKPAKEQRQVQGQNGKEKNEMLLHLKSNAHCHKSLFKYSNLTHV